MCIRDRVYVVHTILNKRSRISRWNEVTETSKISFAPCPLKPRFLATYWKSAGVLKTCVFCSQQSKSAIMSLETIMFISMAGRSFSVLELTKLSYELQAQYNATFWKGLYTRFYLSSEFNKSSKRLVCSLYDYFGSRRWDVSLHEIDR